MDIFLIIINLKIDNDDKNMHRNIPRFSVFSCLTFSDLKMLTFLLLFILYVLHHQNNIAHERDPNFLHLVRLTIL